MNNTTSSNTAVTQQGYKSKHQLCKRVMVVFCIGANKLCYFCGSTNHASSDCPLYA
ncbi:hypothetical protein BC941DRAFT_413082 [Chlamydoabsidia padenii]|nr:hypothetical protein BC941DRAFT_413082 [Chlamydoabsidia padenii]